MNMHDDFQPYFEEFSNLLVECGYVKTVDDEFIAKFEKLPNAQVRFDGDPRARPGANVFVDFLVDGQVAESFLLRLVMCAAYRELGHRPPPPSWKNQAKFLVEYESYVYSDPQRYRLPYEALLRLEQLGGGC